MTKSFLPWRRLNFKALRYVLLAALSSLWAVGLPLLGGNPTALAMDAAAQRDLQEAQAVLLAQGVSGPFETYLAQMSGMPIVPRAVSTPAYGTVGAALAGNRLVVRGSFRELTSALRDFATDPLVPPNPNVTSAFHIHRGAATENGPFLHALEVIVDETGRGGRALADVMLSDEQVAALRSGMMYVDIHTTRFRAGEVRATLMAAR